MADHLLGHHSTNPSMGEHQPRYRQVLDRFRTFRGYGGATVEPRPATREQLAAAELALDCKLPESFAMFQLELGDSQHAALDIYSVYGTDQEPGSLVRINLAARTEEYPPLPSHLVAFSDNGGGDYLCFDTSAFIAAECPVVGWDHERDEKQVPSPEAATFIDWLDAELTELETETRTPLGEQLLGNLGSMYTDWIRRARARSDE